MKITTSQKKTSECFKDFYYRVSYIDSWLPKTQQKCEGDVSVITLDKPMTFLEMAQEYLGSTDVEVIKKHTLTLPMVEELISKHKDSLNTDGYGNLFFVESEDGVSVGFVYRDSRDWNAHVYRLDDGYRWSAGNRLLVRNLGTLESSDTLTLDRALEIVKGAGYEVISLTLAKKFQQFRAKRGNGSGDDYWQGLEEIATKHFSV